MELVVVMSHFELLKGYVDTDSILSSRSLARCALRYVRARDHKLGAWNHRLYISVISLASFHKLLSISVISRTSVC